MRRRSARSVEIRLGLGSAALLLAFAFYAPPLDLIDLLLGTFGLLGWPLAVTLSAPDAFAVTLGAGYAIRLLTRGLSLGVTIVGLLLAVLGAFAAGLLALLIPGSLDDPARVGLAVAMLVLSAVVGILTWDADHDRRSTRELLAPAAGPLLQREAAALLIPLGLSVLTLLVFAVRVLVALEGDYYYYYDEY